MRRKIGAGLALALSAAVTVTSVPVPGGSIGMSSYAEENSDSMDNGTGQDPVDDGDPDKKTEPQKASTDEEVPENSNQDPANEGPKSGEKEPIDGVTDDEESSDEDEKVDGTEGPSNEELPENGDNTGNVNTSDNDPEKEKTDENKTPSGEITSDGDNTSEEDNTSKDDESTENKDTSVNENSSENENSTETAVNETVNKAPAKQQSNNIPPAANSINLLQEETEPTVPVEGEISIVNVNDAATLAQYLNQISDGCAEADGDDVIVSADLNISEDNLIFIPEGVNLIIDNDATLNISISGDIKDKFFESQGTVEVKAGASIKFSSFIEYIGGENAYFNLINGSAVLSDFDIDGNPFMLTLTEGSEAECAKDTILQPLKTLDIEAGSSLSIADGAVLNVTGGLRGISGSGNPSHIYINGTMDCTEGLLSMSAKAIVEIGETGKILIGSKGLTGGSLTAGFSEYKFTDKNITVAEGGVVVVNASAAENKNPDLGKYIYNADKSQALEATKTYDAEGNVYYGTPQPADGTIYVSGETALNAALESESVDTVILRADADSSAIALNDKISIPEYKTLEVPSGMTLTLGQNTAEAIFNGEGQQGILKINAGAELRVERASSQQGISLMSNDEDSMLLIGADDLEAESDVEIQNGDITVNGTLNMDEDAEYTSDMGITVPDGSALNIPMLTKAQMAKKACDITCEQGASVSYADFDIIGGENSLIELNSGSAVINLSNAESGDISLKLDGTASVISELKALVQSADASDNIVPFNVELMENSSVTVAEGASLYIPKNGKFTIDDGAAFNVIGMLTSSPNASISVNGELNIPLLSKAQIAEIESPVYINGAGSVFNYASYPVIGGEDAYLTLDNDSKVEMKLSADKVSLAMSDGAADVNGNSNGELKTLIVTADNSDNTLPFEVNLSGDAKVNISEGKTLSLTNGSSITAEGSAKVEIAEGGKLEIHSEAGYSGAADVKGKIYSFASDENDITSMLSGAIFTVSDNGAVYSNCDLNGNGRSIVVESAGSTLSAGSEGYVQSSISSGETTFAHRYNLATAEVKEPVVQVTSSDGKVRMYESLSEALNNAAEGAEVTLLEDVTADAGSIIPEGVTLIVDGHKLSIGADALSFLGSKGELVVKAGGSLDIAGETWVGAAGSSARLELTEGDISVKLAESMLKLINGAKAVIPEGSRFNLNVTDGAAGWKVIDAEIEQGAELSVNGELRIPSRDNGNKLTVNGILKVSENGKLSVGEKSEITVGASGELSLPAMSKEEMAGASGSDSGIKGYIYIDGGADVSYAGQKITGDTDAYLVMTDGSRAVLDLTGANNGDNSVIGLELESGNASVEVSLLKSIFMSSEGEIIPVSVKIAENAALDLSAGKTLSLANGSSIESDGTVNVNGGILEIHTAAAVSGNFNVNNNGQIYIYGGVDTVSGAKFDINVKKDGNGGVFTKDNIDISQTMAKEGSEPLSGSFTYHSNAAGSDETFTSRWLYTEYTIFFNTSASDASVSVSELETVSHKLPELPVPVREGYTFTGWYNADGTIRFNAGDEVTGDMTVYAQWKENEEPEVPDEPGTPEDPETKIYTITFDPQGGTVDITTLKTEDDGTLDEKLPAASRSGYTFLGWYIAGSNVRVTPNTVFTADTTVYARWVKKSSGSSSSGGSGGSGSLIGNSAYDPHVLVNGEWISDDQLRWWYKYNDGSYPANGWYSLSWNGKTDWYHFDEEGWLDSGWFTDVDGHRYYLHPDHDGSFGYMYTGWNVIDGNYYYFFQNPASGQPMGSMAKSMTTPDGYQVDENGIWIK